MALLLKPRQIKPWPELIGLLPLLKASDSFNKSTRHPIQLDMAQVRKVDAIGLTIFVARLVQTLNGNLGPLIMTRPLANDVSERLSAIKFEPILRSLGIVPEEDLDLFSFQDVKSQRSNSAKNQLNSAASSVEFEEIICVRADDCVNRGEKLKAIKAQIKNFLKQDEERMFAHEQVMIILLELVKNTLDHSGKPALIGLSLTRKRDSTAARFSFVYCDTGEGICHSVRRHMEELSTTYSEGENAELFVNYGRLAKKGSFSDFIHWALKPGNSTKRGNGINLGLGLMLIVQASKHCGIRLAVKDADTMLTLTELANSRDGELASLRTHALIRQLGVTTCSSPMLMFHGEIE